MTYSSRCSLWSGRLYLTVCFEEFGTFSPFDCVAPFTLFEIPVYLTRLKRPHIPFNASKHIPGVEMKRSPSSLEPEESLRSVAGARCVSTSG